MTAGPGRSAGGRGRDGDPDRSGAERPSGRGSGGALPRPIRLADKLALFTEHWSPRIVADVNDHQVKLSKFEGEFVWHSHESEDELFLVLKGVLRMRFRAGDVVVGEGEMIVVPRGVEHLPVGEGEVHVMLVEPRGTLNTGDVRDARTVQEPERI
jgi:mannose-6-phosphate isomerase-like protein (cupin superfamily)